MISLILECARSSEVLVTVASTSECTRIYISACLYYVWKKKYSLHFIM